MLGERRAGPLQGAVDRRDAGAEQLGDLGRRPLQHLAQDQHGALVGRQRCSVATKASRIDSRSSAISAGSPPAGTTRASGTGCSQATSGSGGRAADRRPAAPAPCPSAAPAAGGRRACRSRRWWRSCRARTAATTAPRTARRPSRRAPACPAPRPRPRTPSRASGSSSRSARPGAVSSVRVRGPSTTERSVLGPVVDAAHLGLAPDSAATVIARSVQFRRAGHPARPAGGPPARRPDLVQRARRRQPVRRAEAARRPSATGTAAAPAAGGRPGTPRGRVLTRSPSTVKPAARSASTTAASARPGRVVATAAR